MFTTFSNHHNIPLADENGSFEWSVGTVVRVFDNPRNPPLGRHDLISHSKRMFDAPSLQVTAWGPYPGEMVKIAMIGSRPVVLVAAGSGVGYALDALQWVRRSDFDCSQCRLNVLISTRSKSFFFG